MISINKDNKYSGSILYVYGNEIDPDELGRFLNLPTHLCHKIGENISGSMSVRKHGMWSYKSINSESSFSKDISIFHEIVTKKLRESIYKKLVDSIRISLFIDSKDGVDVEISCENIDVNLISEMRASLYITCVRNAVD